MKYEFIHEIHAILSFLKKKGYLKEFKIIPSGECVNISKSELPFIIFENTGFGFGKSHWFVHIFWHYGGKILCDSFDSLGINHFPKTNLNLTRHCNVNRLPLQLSNSSTCGAWCIFYTVARLKHQNNNEIAINGKGFQGDRSISAFYNLLLESKNMRQCSRFINNNIVIRKSRCNHITG